MSNEKIDASTTQTSPWFWVPSTYFIEGLPGIMIMFVTTIMYKNFGIKNSEITLYVGMLTLPWVIKPLWASLIDIFMTKRWWIYFMDFLMAAGFVAMAFSLTAPMFFKLSLAVSWVIAFMSSSHDIATDGFYIMELKPSQQSFFVGIQGAAYNIGKIFATGLIVMLSGYLFSLTGSYHTAWFWSMIVVAIVILCIGIYHKFILPDNESKHSTKTLKIVFTEFVDVYIAFIKLKRLWQSLLFLFCYQIGETLLWSILPLFMLDTIADGGLGLTDEFTGFAYGVVAPLAIIIGGFIGGYAIFRKGFMAWIWWMLIIKNVPHILYFLLAKYQPSSSLIILSSIAVEQFAFSFGYSGYAIFIFYVVKDSCYKTAHYAFFAGIMMLGVMIPKMYSGTLQEWLGYEYFFLSILLFIIPTAIVILLLKVNPPDYGKTKAKAQ